jgi:ABC-type dipeptide/oligopeptide/nickel transport system permease component
LLGLSIPNFWLAILLIYVFAVVLRVLPAGGYVSPLEDPIGGIRYSILPIVALGTALAALTMRMTRSAVLETLGQDYIRTAHSKGLSPRSVIYNHALRNALIPVVTVVGLQLGGLLGGSIVIEAVFEWPGVGLLLLRAITNADYPMVQGVVLVIAFFVVFANVLVDLSYALLDPRLRSET